MAAVYIFRLCRAISVGVRGQLKRDGLYKDGFMGMLEAGQEMESLPVCKLTDDLGEVLHVQVEEEKIFKADLMGQTLDLKLAAATRSQELENFESKGVWKMRPIEESRMRTGKPLVTVRWVHVSKGDGLSPSIKSRWVARQIRSAGEDAIFAPMPPLEALRSVLSFAATGFVGCALCVRDPKS